MIEYLLDSDVAIYIMNRRFPAAAERLADVIETVGLSAIAYGELAFGMEYSQRRVENLAALAAFIEPLQVVPFGVDAALHYAQIRAELQRVGPPIGGNDMLIAAHAPLTRRYTDHQQPPRVRSDTWAQGRELGVGPLNLNRTLTSPRQSAPIPHHGAVCVPA